MGYERFDYVNKNYCDSVATCTPLNWLALLGVTWGVPCILLYLKLIKNLQVTILSKVLLSLSLILLISTESLLRISIIYVIIFYSINKSEREGKNRE